MYRDQQGTWIAKRIHFLGKSWPLRHVLSHYYIMLLFSFPLLWGVTAYASKQVYIYRVYYLVFFGEFGAGPLNFRIVSQSVRIAL